MRLENLIGISSNGKKKIWKVNIIDDKENNKIFIQTSYGQLNGKLINCIKEIKSGKNIGKKNETNIFQQAINESKSKWNKKIQEGYLPENRFDFKNESESKLKNENNNIVIYPMLSLDYHKRGHDIKFPCYIQPKIDGIRCISYNKNMYSRNNKLFYHLNHIKEELKNFPFIIDGELYSYKLNFQELVGLIKKEKDLSKDEIKKSIQIQYIIYDMISDDHYEDRLLKLKEIFLKNSLMKYIKLLEEKDCQSSDLIDKYYSEYISQGYEGLMLRNKKGKYKQKYRSYDLQKYKKFKEDEYLIISFTEGNSTEKGLIIWICETKEGIKFNVRPKGNFELRSELFKNGDKYIGKYLTIQYQNLTEDNIPRFPIGKSIRDYE
jgi:DNA ligase-1